MFLVTAIGYLTTQLRNHTLTKTVGLDTHSLCGCTPRRPTVAHSSPLDSLSRLLASCAVAPCCQLLVLLLLQLGVEVGYVLYGGCVRGESLLSHHTALLLHCLAACTVLACLLVAHRLYVNEEETERWAAAEEELDRVTQLATQSTYQTAVHELQHDREARDRDDSGWL